MRGAILDCLRNKKNPIILPRHVEGRALLLREENEKTISNAVQLVVNNIVSI